MIGDPADPIGALIAYLSADARVSSIVGDLVMAGGLTDLDDSIVAAMPQPLVLIRGTGGAGPHDETRVPFGVERVDVSCFASDPYDADQLYRAAFGALRRLQAYTHAGTKLHTVKPVSRKTDLRDAEQGWPYALSTWQMRFCDVLVA